MQEPFVQGPRPPEKQIHKGPHLCGRSPSCIKLPFQKAPKSCHEEFFLKGQLPVVQSFYPKAFTTCTKPEGQGTTSSFAPSPSPSH